MDIWTVWRLEQWFDGDCDQSKESLLKYGLDFSEKSSAVVSALLIAFHEKRWSEVLKRAEDIFQESSTCDYQRGIALEFAVSVAENLYDMPLRQYWLGKWNDIPSWPEKPWCIYLRGYHEALTAFFLGHLRDAEAKFTMALESAEQLQYSRGIMRCKFHLALISKERGLDIHALNFLADAKRIASLDRAYRFERRVINEIDEIQRQRLPELESSGEVSKTLNLTLDLASKKSFKKKALESTQENLFDLIRDFLRSRQISAARRLLLRAAKIRRTEARKRGSDYQEIFFALLCDLTRKPKFARRFFKVFDDTVTREIYLTEKQRILNLSVRELAELDFLRKSMGIKSIQSNSSGGIELFGVSLESIPNQDVAHFIKLVFLAPDGIKKESICEAIWGISYDPTIHDPKIYKLIHLSRKLLGEKSWVVNKYGTYHLNPKLRVSNQKYN